MKVSIFIMVLLNSSGFSLTFQSYVERCEEEIGSIPDFNCTDGIEVTVYNRDEDRIVTPETFSESATTCDAPTLIRQDFDAGLIQSHHCVPGSRVGRINLGPGRSFVFTCRKYYNRPNKPEIFDDLNVIMHNRSSGRTCFFVNNLNRTRPTSGRDLGYDGRKVPRIRDQKTKGFWLTPDQMRVPAFGGGIQACVECHDNDPYIHIPYNSDLIGHDGKPVVPSNPLGMYSVVGLEYLSQPARGLFGGQRRPWPRTLRHLVSEQASPCTDCHRIGEGASCSRFARLSVGLETTRFLTNSLRGKAWMPVKDSEDSYHPSSEEARQAVRFINKCCEDKASCKWKPIP